MPVHKARRYVADPSEAPEGVQVQEGRHGGHYYETGNTSTPPPSGGFGTGHAAWPKPGLTEKPTPKGLQSLVGGAFRLTAARKVKIYSSANPHGVEQIEGDLGAEPQADKSILLTIHRKGDAAHNHRVLASWLSERGFDVDLTPDGVQVRPASKLNRGRFDDSLGRAIQLSGFVANARRYVSSPGSAPEGVSVKEGEHGGHYYETGPETAGPKNERPAVTRERERRALDDSRRNRTQGEEQHRRKTMPELTEALDDLNELIPQIVDGTLRNPQELVDAARNVARALDRQNSLAGQDPKRSELASQADADRSALQHALELHQNWKNRYDYAEAKHVPGEEMSAVQERLQSAKNEVLQARDKYKQSRQALDQYSSGKKPKVGLDAELEKWGQIEQEQEAKLRAMAQQVQETDGTRHSGGPTLADAYKQGEVLQQIRNRMRQLFHQQQRATQPGRTMNNHKDAQGSTAHHQDMYRDEYEEHAQATRPPKHTPTPEEQQRQQYGRALDLHEDANGSTEHHRTGAAIDVDATKKQVRGLERQISQVAAQFKKLQTAGKNPDPAPFREKVDELLGQAAKLNEQLVADWKRRRHNEGFSQIESKHADAQGSTDHHHGIKGALGMKTNGQKNRAAALEAARGFKVRAEIERRTGRRLNMHEDANGSTEHHHKGGGGAAKPQYGTERGRLKARDTVVQQASQRAYIDAYKGALADGKPEKQAHALAQRTADTASQEFGEHFDRQHPRMEWPHEQARREKKEQLFNGDRLNMHEDSHGSTEHHHAGGGGRERPTDPRELAHQGGQDALEDVEGMSSDEIRQHAQRSGLLTLWKRAGTLPTKQLAQLYFRKYHQGLMQAHAKAQQRESAGKVDNHEDSNGSTEHHRKGMSAADAHAATEQAHAAWMDAKRTGSPEAPKLQAQWREAGQTLRDLREHEQAEQAEQTAATAKPKRQSAPRAPQFRSELAQRGQRTAQSLLQPGMSQDDIREKYDSLRRATPAAMARTTGDMSYGNMRSKEWHEFQGAALRSLAQAWKQAGSTEDKAGLSIG